MWRVADDETVTDQSGRIIYFGVGRFIADIAHGEACFVCGASRNSVPLNDEHVLPDWILRRYALHDRVITIPNMTHFRYGQLKIPCCASCNSMMGSSIEEPISQMFAGGVEALQAELKDNGPWRLFGWLSLVFLKAHLKDKYLRFHRDHRKGNLKIGELHSWEDIHHVHCVARSFYTGTDIAADVCGTLMVLPAKVRPHFEGFDFLDLSAAQTILFQFDDVAVVAVLNDSQAAVSVYHEELKKIEGPLSPLQLREIAARLAAINLSVVERPRFGSEIDLLNELSKIVTQFRPTEVRLEWNDELFGTIMHHVSKDFLPRSEDQEILDQIKTGRYTFLVNQNGKFNADHMELIDSDQG